MRFPELALRQRGMGAELLSYPSAFMVNTGRAHWEVLLRARAIDTQCFVVAAAQCGFESLLKASDLKMQQAQREARVLRPFDGRRPVG